MIRLVNKNGAAVVLTETGAGIVSVTVPDRNGKTDDVVLGYKDNGSYRNDGPCSGKIPGRYANRIARGKFTLDGVTYHLSKNKGRNHLHGGFEGFANKDWEIRRAGRQSAEFHLTSPDGDEGYPGKLEIDAIYTWSDENELTLDIRAVCDRATVLNLTNHTYWNLSGENSGTILGHELRIFAEKWLPTDEELIPTGEIASVAGTPMDFRRPKKIGADIDADFEALKFGKGYDNCWVLDGGGETDGEAGGGKADGKTDGEAGREADGKAGGKGNGRLKTAAVLRDPASGRKLEVLTTQPAVQIYTGNWLAGSPESKSGRSYNDYEGVAIECQNFPDAPNKKNFPSAVLREGEEFHQIIQFRLSAQ